MFALIQALRGLAALWVVLFHIYRGGGLPALAAALPAFVTAALFGYGSAGVGIFFVLSGFVIAHSLRGRFMSWPNYGRFLLRRTVRLDPAYWASILLALAIGLLLARMHHQRWMPPTVAQIAAHLVYLQEYLRVPEIQLVYWTLTYEVQFYAVLAAAHVLACHLSPRWRGVPFWALAALAVYAAARAGHDLLPGLFVNRWHGFFIGVLAYEAGIGRRSWPAVLALLLLAILMLIVGRFETGIFVTPCALTALGLWVAARRDWLQQGLSGAGWQWLGRISYSLYLVHVPVARVVASLCAHLWHHGPWHDLGGLTVQLAAVLLIAFMLWWLVERPSHRLACRIPQSAPTRPGQTGDLASGTVGRI